MWISYLQNSTNNSKKCELCHDHGMSQKIWITKIRYISAYIELDELFSIYCNNLLPMLYINNWNSYTESTYRHYSLFANQNVTGTQTLRLIKQNFSSNLVLSHKHSILPLNALLSLLLYCVFRMFCGFLPTNMFYNLLNPVTLLWPVSGCIAMHDVNKTQDKYNRLMWLGFLFIVIWCTSHFRPDFRLG